MGKPKKGRKGREDDDEEDDIAAELEKLKIEQGLGNPQDEPDPASTAKPKKNKKKKRQQAEEEDDEEEVNILKETTSVAKPEEEESEEEEEKPTRRAPRSAFELLAEMDDGNEEVKSEEEEKEEEEGLGSQQVNTKASSESQVTKGNKKKEKTKKKKDDDEDIDAILAQLEQKTVPQKDVSAMTPDEIAKMLEAEYDDGEEEKKKKKKKTKKKEEKKTEETEQDAQENKEESLEGEDEPILKSAAQKKKEKKERDKQKKMEEKKKVLQEGKEGEVLEGEEHAEEEKEKKKKKKVKKKKKPEAGQEEEGGEEKTEKESEGKEQEGSKPDEKEIKTKEEAEGKTEEGQDDEDKSEGEEEEGDKKKKGAKKKKGPSKMIQMIKEQQAMLKEAEEKMKREEEERIQREEEALRIKEEKLRSEKERREREKQKKKDKIARAKAEGTFLTEKQKEDRRRAQAMLEQLRQQGIEVPLPGEKVSQDKKKKIVYANKKKKPTSGADVPTQQEEEKMEEAAVEEETEDTTAVAAEDEKKSSEEDVADSWEMVEEPGLVKDSWDVESEEEEKPAPKPVPAKKKETKAPEKHAEKPTEESEDEEESSEEEDDDDEDESEEEESSEDETESESESEGFSKAELMKQKVLERIKNRREAAEKKRTTDVLRAPVVCVLGHVDTGKTKILDKLRRTHVQDGEAGGITQQIGATNVPKDAIVEQTKMCKEFAKQELKLPGMLIIDTPGHESFSNLRSRGSSLCDIAILVVDIMHGLEPQTLESIKLLREKKCPFVVALNKVDRLYGWQPNPHNDVVNTLKKQKQNTRLEFEERTRHVIVQFAEQSLNAALFHENKNPKEFISLVPTSAHSGDGMGNLIALICELSQSHLAKRLAYSEELQAMVMEVKALPGLGTTVDVVLVNGSLKESDTIVIPGSEGPIATQIRGLLMPQPMKELRVKAQYDHFKEVKAAQGVKIIAKDFEKAVAGLPLYVAHHNDEVDVLKEELKVALEDILSGIKMSEKGVFVQASTLGSLEALLQFLRDSKIPYAGINIGPVHKKDVMRASVMLEHDAQYAAILAFDVKIERDSQELADSLGIRIFQADIIYHLFDAFTAYVQEYKKKKQDEFRHLAVFPCKVKIIPQYIFNSRDPIVVGVNIEDGFLKVGTPLCVPSKENIYLGNVTSIEINHKQIDKATKGQEVCIKIENVPGETPKLYGRHFDHNDMVVSKISRATIDAVKDYFRDEMTKNEWHLIMELKKTFEII